MVAVCTQFDGAGACTQTVWMPYAAGPLPALSIADAQQIGTAIALLLALAWGIKMMKRTLSQD